MSGNDSGDIDESLLPSPEECQLRVESFSEITGSDPALAQFFLQDHDWDVQKSVIAYLDTVTTDGAIMESFAGPGAKRTTTPPSQFTFISWNIDGLDAANLRSRTLDVCRLIAQDQPDVVFLQEVIPETLDLLQDELMEYKFISDKTAGYFNVVMLRIFTVYYDSHEVTPLKGSLMDRNLIAVQAHIGSTRLAFLNVHLDSTQPHMHERIGQLKDCFGKMLSFPPDVTVIFGGDTNLRDKEVTMAGNIPTGIDDLWELCGSRETARFTWDLTINTNKQMPGQKQPSLRFDRAYIRYSEPRFVTPINFCIIGLEKVPNLQCFPSDHWGIRSDLKIIKNHDKCDS